MAVGLHANFAVVQRRSAAEQSQMAGDEGRRASEHVAPRQAGNERLERVQPAPLERMSDAQPVL